MATRRSVRKRVAKALRKYLRGNPGTNYRYRVAKGRGGYVLVLQQKLPGMSWETVKSSTYATRAEAIDNGKYMLNAWKRSNPPRVKGRKTKGGRAVTLKNFTGTIVKKSDGTVQIVGRGKRK